MVPYGTGELVVNSYGQRGMLYYYYRNSSRRNPQPQPVPLPAPAPAPVPAPARDTSGRDTAVAVGGGALLIYIGWRLVKTAAGCNPPAIAATGGVACGVVILTP